MQFRVALAVGALVLLSFTWGPASGAALTLAGLDQARPGRSLTPIVPHGSWPVYHRDNARTGNDPTLPQVLSVATGWTSGTLDGEVYASPVIHGGIVYTATLNNTVYALNQIDGSQIWSHHLRAPENRANGGSGPVCGNVRPQGILGTPAIDPAGGRIYVATLDGGDDLYRLEGLNLLTGVEELNTTIPTSIGTGFDWRIQQERGALAVANGYVYVPFGGRAGDCFDGSTPYYGWVVGVPTNGSTTLNVFQTPSGAESVWAPGGVVVDDSSNNVFFATGNAIPCGGSTLSDAVVRLSPALASMAFFEPNDWQTNWCGPDSDLGSASPVLISPTLMFTSGKHGDGFLLDPTNLGGVDGQLFPTPQPAAYAPANVCFGNTSAATYGSFAYAAPFVYAECEGHGLVALNVNTSTPSFSPCNAACAAPDWHVGGSTTFGAPFVAAGAVWVASNSGLTAYRAGTGTLVYQSASFGVNRFVTPAEAGGQVFVPSHTVIRSFVMHFGASQSSPVPTPGGRPGSGQSSPIATPPAR
jgi:outer membrane protein assembly factor BamB